MRAHNERVKVHGSLGKSRGDRIRSGGAPHIVLLAIFKRIELESWDWSQIKDN